MKSNTPPNDPQNMSKLFRNTSSRFPDREALVADNAHLTYAELDLRTDLLAERLQEQGVNCESIISTLLVDGLAMVELSIASAKLGATLLPLNWRLASAELRYIMSDARPQLYFISERFESLFSESGGTNAFVVEDGNPNGALAPFDVDMSTQPVVSEFSDIHNLDVRPENRWYMLYTSGTTGRPKGCQHSQGGYVVNVQSWIDQLGINENDCILLRFPLFHVGAFGPLLCALVSGAKVVIPSRGASHEDVLRQSVEERVTIQLIMGEAAEYFGLQAQLQLPLTLRLLVIPGGTFPVEGVHALANGLNVDIRGMYGQTEAGCWISMLNLKEQIAHPKSCGKAMPHLSTKIVDDNGNEVSCGEVGELLIKGDSITTGYLNLPDATAETIVDGWLHTGDLFYQDEAGFLYITGRKKEMIKTGGENVYPIEVDSVLIAHPCIQDACVAGVPDEKWQEAVKAFVVIAPGQTISKQDVVDWCRQHIAGYKRPRYVEFIAEIPRDFNGKIQRKVLAERVTTAEHAVG